MPQYRFICDRGHETVQVRPLHKFVEYIKCKHEATIVLDNGATCPLFPCGLRAKLGIPRGLMARTFKPYVEEHMPGGPVRIESSAQRDALCKQHEVSYDSARYHTKRPFRSSVEDLTDAEIQQAIEKSRVSDEAYKDAKRKLPSVVAKDSVN